MKTKKQNLDTTHVLYMCLSFIFFTGLMCDYIDNHTFVTQKPQQSCCVDVILGPMENFDKPKNKPVVVSRLTKTNKKVNLTKKEFDCLAKNIYWEAKFEPIVGQVGVAITTSNRVNSGKWGKSFCDVVYSPKQFSWTNIPEMRNTKPTGKYWEKAKASAKLFTEGTRIKTLEKVQHYHAVYVKPKWAKTMNKTATIGNHIFYAKYGD